MADLSTDYLGLKLKNPLVASASPLSEDIANIKKIEDAGGAAVVFHSLFEEQLAAESNWLDHQLSHGEHYAEAISYFPERESYRLGPEGYLEQIRKAKDAVDIPIIGSLNGSSTGGWIEYARKIEEAGADALELNIFYLPTDPAASGSQVENMYVRLVKDVRASVKIPLAVKLGYNFSAIVNFCVQLADAGANGLVLFNRFYLPDFDLENLEITPSLVLSSPYELLLRVRWVAILSDQVKADLAVTGGVHSAEGVLKAMMAGAKVAMMTSALLKNGIGHLTKIKSDLSAWMEEKEYDSIRQMQGSMSHKSVAEPAVYERANYLKVLSSYALRSHP